MKVLVTGAAGFIGSSLVMRILARGITWLVSTITTVCDPALRQARLARLSNIPTTRICALTRTQRNLRLFSGVQARGGEPGGTAGVRYSIENPLAYIDSNIIGFAHVLEGCRPMAFSTWSMLVALWLWSQHRYALLGSPERRPP